jgi:hypothetical protein
MAWAPARPSSVSEGEAFVLILLENGHFDRVEFPRKNFIIKRGGIADMKTVDGNAEVVRSVENENGQVYWVLARKDGRKFFRHLPVVRAKWPEALDDGELRQRR